MAYAPIKQALFVLAARAMSGAVAGGVAPPTMLARLEQRALDAQAADGSFCHSVRLGADGRTLPLPSTHCGTGETTSIVMLALLAAPVSNTSLGDLEHGLRTRHAAASQTRLVTR